MIQKPSPAIAIVGRHNSGKTTLVESTIAELTKRGYDIGSVKHHGHKGFDIDYPGKDSYRHRAAGATETVIVAPDKMARVKTLEHDLECSEIVASMPNHDLVIVEGYRKSGLPCIEIMRADNEADARVAEVFAEAASSGIPLGFDFVQQVRNELLSGEQVHEPLHPDLHEKMPNGKTVAIVTDIPAAIAAAAKYEIPTFHPNDIAGFADFLEAFYVRKHISVVIQAGGESRRMGQSKATVPFRGRPLMSRIVERMAPAADELIITTNEPDRLGFLKDDFPDLDIRLVTDVFDKRGALQGFYTALNAAKYPLVAIVACDMVFASPLLTVVEAYEIMEPDVDAVIPVNKHGFEPFHAVYRKDKCLVAVSDALEAGETRVQGFLPRIRVKELPHAKVLEVEPQGGCFINANTPDELNALEELLRLE